MLKKHSPIFYILLIVTIIAVCSVFFLVNSNITTAEIGNPDDIPFEYFYRGFTPITDKSDINSLESVVGECLVFLTEDDWIDFTQKYCTYAGFLKTPDFTNENLIAVFSLIGTKASANSLHEIKTVSLTHNTVSVFYDYDNLAKTVYALNLDGIGHLAINVIRVNKNDMPKNVEGVYYLQN